MERKPFVRSIKRFLRRFAFAWMCARSCSPLHVDYIVTLMALENRGVDSHTICECCFVNSHRRKQNIRKEERQ